MKNITGRAAEPHAENGTCLDLYTVLMAVARFGAGMSGQCLGLQLKSAAIFQAERGQTRLLIKGHYFYFVVAIARAFPPLN